MEKQPINPGKDFSLFSQVMRLSDHTMVMDEGCRLHQAVLLLQGTKRTSDLLRQISGISPKMLTQTLKKLESARLVVRQVHPVVPPKVEYRLTDSGRELEEVLARLYDWSVKRELVSG